MFVITLEEKKANMVVATESTVEFHELRYNSSSMRAEYCIKLQDKNFAMLHVKMFVICFFQYTTILVS